MNFSFKIFLKFFFFQFSKKEFEKIFGAKRRTRFFYKKLVLFYKNLRREAPRFF